VHLRARNGRYLCLAGGVPRVHAQEPCCCDELLMAAAPNHKGHFVLLFPPGGSRVLSAQPDGAVTASEDAGDTGCAFAACSDP